MSSERSIRHERYKPQEAALHAEIEGLLSCESRISHCYGEWYNYFFFFFHIPRIESRIREFVSFSNLKNVVFSLF